MMIVLLFPIMKHGEGPTERREKNGPTTNRVPLQMNNRLLWSLINQEKVTFHLQMFLFWSDYSHRNA
jgi:hypothetical protein